MDWMYKEHARNEESSPDMNNQCSLCDPSTKLEDKNFTVINENEDRVDHFEDIISSQTDLDAENEEGDAEDSSTIVGPITSDLDELTAKAMDSKQPGVEKDIDGLEKMAEEVCENEGNKDKAIKLLRKEIDSLKTKIVELEKQCGGGDTRLHQGNKEDPATIREQPIDEKLPSVQDDAPKNYTPYIKYTKLEFKVDTFFAVGSPLGVFLALRNIRIGIGKGKEYWGEENISEEMPACRQMFNIFHPFDPVAYRIGVYEWLDVVSTGYFVFSSS
uniref:DDHD domain-containing protein n=1 Tax=Fagus sylvatica TaxID=28930 RepID=A0A2N9I6S3_FAGSY